MSDSPMSRKQSMKKLQKLKLSQKQLAPLEGNVFCILKFNVYNNMFYNVEYYT